MASRIAQAYDTLVLHNPKLVLVVLLSILVFFGYHTKDFKLDASADSLFWKTTLTSRCFGKSTSGIRVATYSL